VELGFSSVFDWLVRGFKYSNASAYRRIEAARMLKSAPQVLEKLEDGKLNLTTVSRAQTILKTHEKLSGEKVSSILRCEMLEKIEGKSLPDVEKVLLQMFPEASSSVHQERKVVLNENTTRCSVNLPNQVEPTRKN